MKIINNIAALLVGIALLTGCNDDITSPAYTVGEADNAIVLRAGISEGGAGVPTRAGAEDNHDATLTGGGHKLFASGTKAALQVNGDWWKTAEGPATTIQQPTTVTMGDKSATTGNGQLHNSLEMSPQLYWDDYGTADPSNTGVDKGRKKGLTIYGVAVDGEPSAPVVDGNAGKQWGEYAWTLVADQSDATTYWKNQDLLISNNVKEGTGDGCFKFDTSPRSKLLEFTHAMSKITVRLIASDGFPTTGDGLVGNTTNKFKSAPEVVLTSNEGESTSNTEWPYTQGNVNITTGAVTGQAGSAKVKMHTQSITDVNYTAIYDALVMPGSCFGATDDAIIARINADDNIYYVTADSIRTKMHALNSSTDYKTEAGKNYIITVNVKKTKIEVTATIVNWTDVESETVNPVINVNASYGSSSGTALSKDSFSFYRSTEYDDGYSNGCSDNANGYFAAESSVTQASPKWIFSTPLYWTDHNTHYQMRGVWPLTVTTAGDNVSSPRVETTTHNTKSYQVIKVKNVKYEEGTFPSDLAIGRPNVAEDATCNNTDHDAKNLYSDGICATEGIINLEFEYMMSKIEVNLSTTGGNDKVELENAVVEITNLYTAGDIKLGDREAIVTGSTSIYALHTTSEDNKFMDAIVPQTLTYSTAGTETNVRFKITITNKDEVLYADATEYNAAKNTSLTAEEFNELTDEQKTKFPATKDVYYADVNPILKKGSTTEKVAPDGKWKSGKHYVYDLKLSKTKIDVIAHFKDWEEVEASQDVWF